jgi:uncharacterized phage-like protein YoqJ
MIIAGTGHRPDELGGFTLLAWKRLVDVATDSLKQLRPSKVISGMAQGWDQALAQAAKDLEIPFIAAVPFKDQDAIWPATSKRRYANLLNAAESIVYVCAPGYAPEKMQARNEWMVDNSDGMVIIWNGKKHGGTWNCLEYAVKVGKPILHNAYGDWVAWEEENA